MRELVAQLSRVSVDDVAALFVSETRGKFYAAMEPTMQVTKILHGR